MDFVEELQQVKCHHHSPQTMLHLLIGPCQMQQADSRGFGLAYFFRILPPTRVLLGNLKEGWKTFEKS
ncbi:MAG: hypothetical protein ACJATT_005707, partial [Myxococcota bacterium]